MSTNEEKNKEKKGLFENLGKGIGNIANAVGKGAGVAANAVGKGAGVAVDVVGKGAKVVGDAAGTVAKGTGDVISKAVEVGSDIAENQRIKKINNEIDTKILEHKFNIGSYIYDNEIDVDDGVIISTINTIDRLVEEIKEIGGENNG